MAFLVSYDARERGETAVAAAEDAEPFGVDVTRPDHVPHGRVDIILDCVGFILDDPLPETTHQSHPSRGSWAGTMDPQLAMYWTSGS